MFSSRRSSFATAIVALALCLLALAWYLRQPAQLAERYQAELAAAPDDQVEPSLRRIAELGDIGLKALAAALASDRPVVRQAAHRLLVDMVDRWELLSSEAIEPRLELLARALAEAVPRMDVEDRRLASDLAMRLLLWPRADERAPCPWLADCDAILASAAEHKHSSEDASGTLATKNSDPRSEAAEGNPGVSDLSLTLADKVRLPGGDLPLDPSPMPDVRGFVEPRITHREEAPASSGEPRRLQFPSDARSIDGNDDGDDDDATGSEGANHPGRIPAASRGARPTALGLQARRQSLGGPRSDDTAAWRQLEPRDVMRRLHVSDPQVVLAARVELERRGISGPLVDLARRATDPDPNVRKQFAESLPSMPGIDAKPWLLELSYDENSQVRATAVGLMATSGDLELIRRLEQISRDDPDDYIRAQAAKGVK